MTAAIAVRDGRTQINIPGEVVAAGWLPPSVPLTWEDWLATLTFARRLDSSLKWVLGDLMLYGDGLFGENHIQAVDGLSAATLMEVVRVAGSYEHDERFAELSFEHHREVAHFPRVERAALLLAASTGEQSRAVLRQEAHPVADRLGLPRRGPGPVRHVAPAVETQALEANVVAATRGEARLEALAAWCHAAWSRRLGEVGVWRRTMGLPYADLPSAERDAARGEAAQILAALEGLGE